MGFACLGAPERQELPVKLVRVGHAVVALPLRQNLGRFSRDAGHLQRNKKHVLGEQLPRTDVTAAVAGVAKRTWRCCERREKWRSVLHVHGRERKVE